MTACRPFSGATLTGKARNQLNGPAPQPFTPPPSRGRRAVNRPWRGEDPAAR
jgi:hypothetical protein